MKNTNIKKMALSARSKWLESYSALLSNGFTREVVKVWKKDGKIFNTNKGAMGYLKKILGGK